MGIRHIHAHPYTVSVRLIFKVLVAKNTLYPCRPPSLILSRSHGEKVVAATTTRLRYPQTRTKLHTQKPYEKTMPVGARDLQHTTNSNTYKVEPLL